MSCANLFGLDNCVKCTICVSHCPVARVSDKFAGPKQYGPDLERFRLEEAGAVCPSVTYCTNCKNCDVACPSGVNVSAMICRAKGELVGRHGAAWRDRLMARVDLLGKYSRLSPALINWCAGNSPIRWLVEKTFGVSKEMTLPRYAGQTFYDLFSYKKKTGGNVSGERIVVYYPGCYVNYHNPGVGMALVEVMVRNGIRVLVEKFNCCGLPLISNGFLSEAQKYARKNIQQLRSHLDRDYRIITSCPSCSLTLRREYREVLGLVDAGRLSSYVQDAFEYLWCMSRQGELDTSFKSVPLRAGYHLPCHLKAGGYGVPSREILGLIPGLRVHDLDAGCCGLSGSCGFKREKYANSMAIGWDLFRSIKEMDTKQVITECGICQLQIQHGAGVTVYHPVQVLAEAFGLGGYIRNY